MKKIIVFLLFPFFVFSQSQEEQLVVDYTMDYKLPLLKRVAKGMMPKSCTVTYSSYATRMDNSTSLLKGKINYNITAIENYDYLKSSAKTNIIAKKKGKTVMDSSTYVIEDIIVDTLTKLYFNNQKKIILDIECEEFTFENEDEKGFGCISRKHSAIGALVTGVDYGLPLEFEVYDKKEKITAIMKVQKINIEPLDNSLYDIVEE